MGAIIFLRKYVAADALEQQQLEQRLEGGRGDLYLNLDPDQYRKLRS